MKRAFLALALFGAPLGAVSAHAYLETSDPEAGATLQTAPEQITLSFSEPLELRFSTFEIAPLETDATDPREVRVAAQDLMAEVLGQSGDNLTSGSGDESDEAGSQMSGEPSAEVLNSERTAREVVLELGNLEPGTYVVMWRLLSTDTHASDDFVTFTVAPGASTSEGD